MGANVCSAVTAGDLIRRAIADGATELGLAKQLAGTKDDTNPEVKRWRYVVRRAHLNSEAELSEENARRVAEFFGEPIDPPQRPGRGSLHHRLAKLEAELRHEVQSRERALQEAVARLVDLEERLERLEPPQARQQTDSQ